MFELREGCSPRLDSCRTLNSDMLGETCEALVDAIAECYRVQGNSRLKHSCFEYRIWHRRQSVFAMLLGERLERSGDKINGHTPCHSAPATGIVARSELLGEGSAHHLNSCGAPSELGRRHARLCDDLEEWPGGWY